MQDTPDQRLGFFGRVFALLRHHQLVTFLSSCIVVILTPFLTGFANWTFSTKSWEMFGKANEPGAPGAYLAPNSVYSLPFYERFYIDGGATFSTSWHSVSGVPVGTITDEAGTPNSSVLTTLNSLTAEVNCRNLVVYLMRQPEGGDERMFIMYTSLPLDSEDCRGWRLPWSR